MVEGRYYTVQEAAQVLSCDDETILAWIHSGQLVAIDISKRPGSKRPTWRIPETSMASLIISRRRIQPTAPAQQKPRRRLPKPKQFV
jgi:excisionase family DNA binding protein